MRKLSMYCLVLVLILFSIPAAAQIPSDIIGLYFDTEANIACAEGVLPFTPVSMYLIYSYPVVDELFGYELGITMVGSEVMLLSYQAICGLSFDPLDLEEIRIGCGVAVPCIEHTILMSMEWFYLSTTSELILFTMHGAATPSMPGDTPLILLGDGSFLPVAVNEIGSGSSATAAMTGSFDVCNPLPTAEKSWDSVKSLYR